MRIRFLGVGGAFDFAYGNASAVIDFQGQRLLFDCGHAVFPELCRQDLLDQLDGVIITHLHDDHVGSLSTLLFFHSKVMQKGRLPVITGSDALRQELMAYLRHAMLKPEDFAEFLLYEDYDGLGVIDTSDRHMQGMRSYGYIFAEENQSPMIISGDLGDGHFLFDELERAGIKDATIFHDLCFFPGVPAHAHYHEIAEHLPDFHIFGYHHNPSMNPADNPVPLVWDRLEYRFAPR